MESAPMRKIEVYRRGMADADLAELLVLLQAAGVPRSDIEVIDDVPPPDEACDDEIVVFLLSPAVLEAGELNEQIARVPDGGRRAICVWPADSKDSTVPAGVAKFSYSIVSWNVERLGIALANDDVTCFETPAGEPMQMPDTERLECP